MKTALLRPHLPRHIRLGLTALFALVACLADSRSEVTSIRIHARGPYDGGRSFGNVGPYEKLEGVMHFTADPGASGNRGIVDIGHAPINSRGQVEFEAEFRLVTPVDRTRGNGALMFDVVNRGRATWESGFGTPDSPQTSASFLLDRGFTVLEIGWQHDVPTAEGSARLLRVKVPVATIQGRPIRGLVAVSFTLAQPAESAVLSDRGHVPYPVADPNAPGTQLTIRHLDGRSETVPREKWGFRGNTRIYMEGGFAGGRSYDVIYQSENPPVTGLGYAAVRDGVAAVKAGQFSELGVAAGTLTRALAVGRSQSGRFLRGFINEGFNRDLSGNRLFEGAFALIAGGSRITINYRFAQPSVSPGLLFPFSDASQVDAETAESGGLLEHVPAPIRPKMMYLNTSSEYWRASNAGLVHTRVDGSGDFPLAEGTRLYVVAGAQHGPAPWPVKKTDRELAPNPLNYRWVVRAAFLALDRWVSDNTEPPASRYPRLGHNELTTPDRLGFPAIPGVTIPPGAQMTKRARLPPNFFTEGPITNQPPRPGSPYPHWV
jgi:hypothetical protein